MEKTLDNKGKFFAQYWGQPVCTYEGREISLKTNGLLDSEMFKAIKWRLELKDISSITDEDAIEIAKLMLSNGRLDSIDLMSEFSVKRFDEEVMYREPEQIHVTFMANLFADKIEKTRLTIYPNTLGVSFYLGYFREIHESLPLHGILMVIDYLRSKGYALPYNGVTVETLIEWGWLKLIKKELV